ncbi:MAG: response regulator [Candidatus Cyclobacteriaceae bacterium M2_1C_046]
MNKPIQLLLADDHKIILDSLSNSLNEQPDIMVMAQASTGTEVLQELQHQDFDVVILDLNMPEKNGLECMEVISKEYPHLKVLFLTIYQEEYVIKKLIELGAKGFLLKNVSLDKLLEVIRCIHKGGTYFDDLPDLYFKNQQLTQTGHDSLTPREKEIIKLTVQGLPSHEIADQLFISEYTANTHRKNILRKLKLANIAQLVAFAKSSGILE